MNDDRINKLIDALLQQTITDGERLELLEYYNSFQTDKDWNTAKMGDFEATKQKVWEQIIQQRPQHKTRMRSLNPWIGRVAASAMLLVGVWIVYLQIAAPEMITIISQTSPKEVILPDGSQVHMNVNSRITFPKEFAADRREITFEGEAFFEITTDSLHPLFISTDDLKVKVVGTQFNLKAYRNDPTVETSLIKGKVILLSKDEESMLSELQPNQKFIASRREQPATVTTKGMRKRDIHIETIKYISEDSSIPVDLAWKSGKMAFSSASLDDIARLIKRMRGVQVTILDSEIAANKYSATFEDESAMEILEALRLVKPFNYRKEGTDIVIF